jgi:lysophospholipase L1-like esterase
MRHGFFCGYSCTPIRRIGFATICAVGLAGCDKLGLGDKNPTSPTAPSSSSSVVYTAIGASDAVGVGSSVICLGDTECADGAGYVPVTVKTLKSQGRTVTTRNLGIPTAVISRSFQILGTLYGRIILGNFIDNELPSVLTNSTMVTIFAGVNDINTITSALGGGAGANNQLGYLDSQVQTFIADYGTLVNGVRSRAPQARIVVLNVPNVAGLPYLSGASLQQRQAAQRAAVGMTAGVNALARQGVAIVDLMCDSRSYLPSNYSSDGMHPNDSGYAFIAGLVVNAMTASSPPPPQGSCGPMTIVPNL